MNFNLYLDDATAKRLGRLAKKLRKPRNAVIREAVEAWLLHEGPSWPDSVAKFRGDPSAPRFEATRAELGKLREDPFG